MDWLLQRYSDNGNSTQGLFFQKNTPLHLWHSHALEDEFRKDKVGGETRLDAGDYELKISKFITNYTQKKHGFSKGDCLVQPLPRRKYVKSTVPTRWLVIEIVDADNFTVDELSPLTFKHRLNYNIPALGNWFRHHIEISGLPRHKSVYIHGGNNERHTDACLLLGDTIHNHTIERDRMERSLQAVKRFYDVCYPYLLVGNRSYLEVRDEIELL